MTELTREENIEKQLDKILELMVEYNSCLPEGDDRRLAFTSIFDAKYAWLHRNQPKT